MRRAHRHEQALMIENDAFVERAAQRVDTQSAVRGDESFLPVFRGFDADKTPLGDGQGKRFGGSVHKGETENCEKRTGGME